MGQGIGKAKRRRTDDTALRRIAPTINDILRPKILYKIPSNDALHNIKLVPARTAHAKWLDVFNSIIARIKLYQPPISRWRDFFCNDLLNTKIPVAKRVCQGVDDAYATLVANISNVDDKYHANDVNISVIEAMRTECRIILRAAFVSAINSTPLLFFF